MKTANDAKSRQMKSNSTVISESFKPDFENPGVFPWVEANRIIEEKLSGIWYFNPIAVVYSLKDSDEFLETVMRRQSEWFRHLSRQFKNGWRRKRASRLTTRWERGYEYDGVVVVNCIVIPFEDWSRERRTNEVLAGLLTKK